MLVLSVLLSAIKVSFVGVVFLMFPEIYGISISVDAFHYITANDRNRP